MTPFTQTFTPHAYQGRAINWLTENKTAALFLDPGLGKTVCTLTAFAELKTRGEAKKMLVVAPKRVCYLVWEQEGAKWEHLNHLKFALLHGRKKMEAFKSDADVYLINPEGIPWLIAQFETKPEFKAMFDTVAIDELTKFKNAMSKRWKAFYPYARWSDRRWGLTGTPAPNGLADLFGQVKILDDGNRLGRYKTHFFSQYFTPHPSGFGQVPLPSAETRIQEKLQDFALRMKADDYLDMPSLVNNHRKIELPKKSMAVYNDIKKTTVAEMESGATITAANAAAVHGKLQQVASGAVYHVDAEGVRHWDHIHDAKLDDLKDLVEELQGQPLLVAYQYNHELERIQEALGGDIPYLGKGVSDSRMVDIERDWNRNMIPVLLVHPASTGHGLNLQKGGAKHIVWFSPTWDFELYDQLIRRLLRQGNTSTTIFNHLLVAEGTVDELAIKALNMKDRTQESFNKGLSEHLKQTGTPEKETTMAIQRLGASGTNTAPPPTATSAPAPAPKAGGWGARKSEIAKPAPAPTRAPTPGIDETRMVQKLARSGVSAPTQSPPPTPTIETVQLSPEEFKAATSPTKTPSPQPAPSVKGNFTFSYSGELGELSVRGEDAAALFKKLSVLVEGLTS